MREKKAFERCFLSDEGDVEDDDAVFAGYSGYSSLSGWRNLGAWKRRGRN